MEITVAGNPTVDLVYTNEGVYKRYGGPILYASKALRALGAEVRAVGVAAPQDIKELEKELPGVQLDITAADTTTTFLLDYREKPRKVRLLKKPAVGIERVEGDIVILSPVFDELKNVKIKARLLAVDLQGYIRAGYTPPNADLVHFSLDDIQLTLREFTAYAAVWPRVVYTLGEEGAYVYLNREIYHVNSANLKVEDVTGSGDVFFAIVTYLHLGLGIDLLDAVCEASKYTAGFLISRSVTKYEFDCAIQAVQV